MTSFNPAVQQQKPQWQEASEKYIQAHDALRSYLDLTRARLTADPTLLEVLVERIGVLVKAGTKKAERLLHLGQLLTRDLGERNPIECPAQFNAFMTALPSVNAADISYGELLNTYNDVFNYFQICALNLARAIGSQGNHSPQNLHDLINLIPYLKHNNPQFLAVHGEEINTYIQWAQGLISSDPSLTQTSAFPEEEAPYVTQAHYAHMELILATQMRASEEALDAALSLNDQARIDDSHRNTRVAREEYFKLQQEKVLKLRNTPSLLDTSSESILHNAWEDMLRAYQGDIRAFFQVGKMFITMYGAHTDAMKLLFCAQETHISSLRRILMITIPQRFPTIVITPEHEAKWSEVIDHNINDVNSGLQALNINPDSQEEDTPEARKVIIDQIIAVADQLEHNSGSFHHACLNAYSILEQVFESQHGKPTEDEGLYLQTQPFMNELLHMTQQEVISVEQMQDFSLRFLDFISQVLSPWVRAGASEAASSSGLESVLASLNQLKM